MSDYWEDSLERYDPELSWDDVSGIHVFRDESGWSVYVETDGGEMVELESGLDDLQAEDLIWDDLYWFAEEYDIEFDKDIQYAED